MTETEQYEQQRQRKRNRNRTYDDECGTFSGAGSSTPIQTPSQRFERTVFFAIIDSLLVALSKRQAAYEKLNSVFGFHCPVQISYVYLNKIKVVVVVVVVTIHPR